VTLRIGAVIGVALALVALVGPLVAPYEPRAVVGPSLAAPSTSHLLGTNDAGQDVLSQLLAGARWSLVTALVAAALAVAIGVLVGATAGLIGGWADVAAMRLVDVFLALPGIPAMVLVAALVGPSRAAIAVLIGLAGWAAIARIVRAETLRLAGRGFVASARGFGAGRFYLVRRHVVPAIAPLAAAGFVNWAAAAIVLEAGLAFLGLGDPTDVSWGSVLQRALHHEGVYFTAAWTWWALPTGSAITLAAVGLAFLAVGLEPRANPRWRQA
jgi:peptide/nickel transport system permease protein